MITELQIVACFELIAADHPNFGITESRVALWHSALADLPADLVQQAVADHLGRDKWEPKLADVRRGCGRLAGSLPPSIDQAVEQVRSGGPYHWAVVRVHSAIGDAEAWSASREPERLLADFRRLYRDMFDQLADEACEPDVILDALTSRREALTAPPAPPQLEPAPDVPPAHWETPQGESDALANRQQMTEMWKGTLGKPRTVRAWRKELGRRTALAATEWKTELGDIADTLAETVGAPAPQKFDPNKHRTLYRESRFLLMRSWTEYPEAGSTGVTYALPAVPFVTIQSAYGAGVGWLRETATLPTMGNVLVEIGEQRMERRSGKYVRADDEVELVPEGRITTVARFGVSEVLELSPNIGV